MKRLLYPAGILACILLGILLRKMLPKPYVWNFSFLCWALSAALFTLWARGRTAAVYAGILSASLLLALFAAETWLGRGRAGEDDIRRRNVSIVDIRKDRKDPDLQPHQSNLVYNDPVLGYRPKAESVRTATRVTYDGEIVYDAVYSTLPSGWRVTPQHPEADKAVVFFGCSFTFGYGLNDEQSFPYQLGSLLGDEWQVFNFALTGYGSHQMLAQIQHGFVADIAKKYKKVVVFYVTLSGHEMRSAGHSGWDRYGPWYALEKGRAVRKGNFPDRQGKALSRVFRALRNCLVFQQLTQPRLTDMRPLRELHVAIMAEADRELRERYGLPLTVVLWPDGAAPSFAGALAERRVTSLDLKPLFPGGEYPPERYTIPHDLHPNAEAASIVARILAGYVKQ